MESLTVTVTVLLPILLQSKRFGVADLDAIPQASLSSIIGTPLSMASPLSSRYKTSRKQATVGGILSCTSTVAVQVAMFSAVSSIVRVTVLSPTSSQSKEKGANNSDKQSDPKKAAEKQAMKKAGETLVKEEEREEGSVEGDAYRRYTKAGGYFLFFTITNYTNF